MIKFTLTYYKRSATKTTPQWRDSKQSKRLKLSKKCMPRSLPEPNGKGCPSYETMMKIVLTVTNDLNYDQRMIRICSSLASHGYQVLLVGRKMHASPPLLKR